MNTYVTLATPLAQPMNTVTDEHLCHAPQGVNSWSENDSNINVQPASGSDGSVFREVHASCCSLWGVDIG
jgi:hypothetical protein